MLVTECRIHQRLGPFAAIWPRGSTRVSRLALFTAVSIALHALTLSYTPSAITHAPGADAGSLHAVLIGGLAERPVDVQRLASEAPAQAPAAAEVSGTAAGSAATDGATAIAAANDAVELPIPENWFAADQLDTRAEPLETVPLEYPAEFLSSGVTARARILLYIDERGIVRKASVAAVSADTAFGEAARNAWADVRFSPATKNGAPVKSRKLVEVVFEPQ